MHPHQQQLLTDFDYLYNRNGNQSQKIDNVTGVVTAYEYDLIGQLTEEQKTNGTTVTLKDSYTYDASGNRLTKVEERPDTLAKTVASTYNKNNQQRAFKVGLALFLPKG
ncbi:MAG: RHS repeat protein [Clostridia bacterium]|nr:RHS repeat protein [Clostridia bacterium]